MNLIKVIQKLLARFGFELKLRSQSRLVDQAVTEKAELSIRKFTMLSNSRLVSLADQVAHCNLAGIDGALVECGVWKGGAVALMAEVCKATGNIDRDLHLFDAFTDICAPDPELDGAKAVAEAKGFHKTSSGNQQPMTGFYDRFGGHGTIQACREVIGRTGYPESRIHFHKGWFKDTVFIAETGPIAILRLDGDWYESTRVCLDALYDKVVPGGFIIFDDYLTYEGCKAAVDDFMTERGITSFLHRCDTSCYYLEKS